MTEKGRTYFFTEDDRDATLYIGEVGFDELFNLYGNWDLTRWLLFSTEKDGETLYFDTIKCSPELEALKKCHTMAVSGNVIRRKGWIPNEWIVLVNNIKIQSEVEGMLFTVPKRYYNPYHILKEILTKLGHPGEVMMRLRERQDHSVVMNEMGEVMEARPYKNYQAFWNDLYSHYTGELQKLIEAEPDKELVITISTPNPGELKEEIKNGIIVLLQAVHSCERGSEDEDLKAAEYFILELLKALTNQKQP